MILKKKLEWFENVTLKQGNHSKRSDGVCVMEAVAYLAGELHFRDCRRQLSNCSTGWLL